MNRNRAFICSGIYFLLFLLLILLVRTVDVAAIGPEGTSIGLSHINQAVHDLFGVQNFWYDVTKVMLILAVLSTFAVILIGVLELLQRRSILAVDSEILAFGVLLVVLALVYAFFEVVIVNYRPIIMEDATGPEASFPSSHTMLICTIMGAISCTLKKYIRKPEFLLGAKIFCNLVIVITVIGRLVCGVHWFTDILGGVLISLALVYAYAGVIRTLRRAKKQRRRRR